MEDKLQELLTITMEECGELIQACSKAIRCNDYYDNDKLIEELIAPRFKFTSNGKIKVEAKDEFKKRLGGRSCDLADAFCLTFAQQAFTASARGGHTHWNKPIQYKDSSWIT